LWVVSAIILYERTDFYCQKYFDIQVVSEDANMRQKFEHDGNSFEGFLALPESGNGRGLLVFHAWWGLNPFIWQTCLKLAREGYVVLAPDYYGGIEVSTIEQAIQQKTRFDRSSANKLTALAADYLVSQPEREITKLGALGFSLGASLAIEVARRRNQLVKAEVLFYGSGGGKFDLTRAAFLAHFAEDDQWGAHDKKVSALAERIKAAGQQAVFHTYPNTRHWFMETDRPEYDQKASDLAWKRTLSFLEDQLD
jgi:carboxymethylenebutenolidase